MRGEMFTYSLSTQAPTRDTEYIFLCLIKKEKVLALTLQEPYPTQDLSYYNENESFMLIF